MSQDYAHGLAWREIKRTERRFPCTVTRVVDGDTLHVIIDHGFKIQSEQIVRVFGVNAPEMSTTEGRRVQSLVQRWLGLTLLDRPQHTLLSYTKDDKYGRRLADIERIDDGKKLSVYLLEEGHAVEYLP